MKITAMKIINFLNLEDVELTPDDKKNVFIGKNRQGKTSILKAIDVGFNGTKDDTVINNNADQAKIFIEIDNGTMTLDRTIRRDAANRLIVKGEMTLPNGDKTFKPLPAPQELLTNIISRYSFDPIKFVLLEGTARVKYFQLHFPATLKPETLKGKVSDDVFERLNFDDDALTILKQVEDAIYPARTKINKEVREKKAVYDVGIKTLDGFEPDKYKDRTDECDRTARECENKLTAGKTIVAQNETSSKHIKTIKDKITDINIKLDGVDEQLIASIPKAEAFIKKTKDEVAALLGAIAVAQEDLAEAEHVRDKRDALKDDIDRHEDTIASYPAVGEAPDVLALEDALMAAGDALSSAKTLKLSHSEYTELQAIKVEYEEKQTESDAITATLNYITKELPTQLAKEANFPIDNISIDGDKMFVNGISIDNCSTKEGVSIGLEIVRAIAPENGLKTICLDRIESLDDESFEEFDKQIQNDEFQYWVTKVQHKGEAIPLGAYRVTEGKLEKVS